MAAGRVNAGWQLLGLLAFAFVGSGVARGRRVRGFGLPTGSEWLLAGILLGPQVLRLVGPSELSLFAPLVAAGTGWVALTTGQRFGVLSRPKGVEEASAGVSVMWLGIFTGMLMTAAVGALTFVLLGKVTGLSASVRLASAVTVGIALSGSTRQLIDWARERLGAKGPFTDHLEAQVSGSELVALLGTAPLMAPLLITNVTWEGWSWRALSPIALGTLLGLMGLGLLRLEARQAETWGILLGTTLLATGIALRTDTSVMATGFVLGWVLGRDRNAGHTLRQLTHPTEGTVMLPLMVMAGAVVDWSQVLVFGPIVAAAVLLRWLLNLTVAWLKRRRMPARGLSVVALGLVLSTSGELACLVGLGFWLVVPGALGQFVLAAAIVNCLLGELVGAWSVRRILWRTGELGEPQRSESQYPGWGP